MKINNKFILLFAIVGVLTFAFVTPVSADTPDNGRTIFGDTYILGSGEILDGDLTVFGGVVTIENGGIVSGNVVFVGSVVTISGTIEGDLSMFGGTLTLDETALIEGNLSSASSYIEQDPGAVIMGDFTQSSGIPWTDLHLTNLPIPQIITSAPTTVSSLLTKTAQFLGLLLAFIALGALMVLIAPKATGVMTQALSVKPLEVLGYGALTTAAMVVGGVMLSLTICMIPVVALVGLAFLLAVLAGWLALGNQIGKMIETGIFKATWHPVLTAALGNAVLFLLARGLMVIPCLGAFLVLVAALFGLGMAVVTLFGTNPFPRAPKVTQPEILFPENAPDEEIPSVEGNDNKTNAKDSKD